ncbi:unnamed protein product [Closterium sp. NIES-64]|nr:unnamed protein product [Closterium sp. NIES-64]
MGKPKPRPATKGAGKGKATATQRGSNTASCPASAGRTRLLLQGRAGRPGQNQQAAPKPQGRAQGRPQGSLAHSQSGGGNAAAPPPPPPPLTTPLAASPRSAPPAGPVSRAAGRARTTGVSCTSQRASRAARRELGARQDPRQGEEAGLGRAGEVTVELGALGDEAAAAGRAGENDVAGTMRVAAVVPGTAAATVREVAAAAASAVETVVDPMPAGGSAAAFGGDSTSPSATPRVAQSEAEEPSPGADQEQTAEAALSASPAPVTAAVLAAAVSAAAGKQGGAPTAEDVMIVAASAKTPVAAVAANRQEHGHVEDEVPGRANGDSSGAARAKSKKKLRAQPAPRRPGTGLGPGPPGPLLGWLLQGQPPSERAHRSSSAHTQEARGVSGLNEVANETTATHEADQPASNQDDGTGVHLPPCPVAPATEGVAIRRSARLGTVTWGPPRGGRSPWMPAGRAGLETTARSAPVAGRGLRGMGRGRRGGGRGGVARLGGAEIQARTGPWRERHDRPEVSEAAANGDEAGSAEENGDPDFMCGEEPGPESEEVSLENEEEVGGRRNRAGGIGEAVEGETSHAVGVTVPAAAVANEAKSPAALADDDAIWQMAGTWTLDLLQRLDQPCMGDSAIPPEADAAFANRASHWQPMGSN